MKNNTAYTFDPVTLTLAVSAVFAKKASKLGTPEYDMLLHFRKDYPKIKIVKRDSDNKGNHTGIKFAQMERFIGLCRDSEPRLATFQKIKSLSKIQSSPYAYVKEWFLNNYANYSEQPEFDADGFVIVKTKAEMEAEKKSAGQTDTEKIPFQKPLALTA